MEEIETIIISTEETGDRLDKILAGRYKELHSRTYFQMLIEEQKVLLNGSPVKKRIKPQEGDEVEICFALTPEIDITPQDIPLDILFEDEHLLAINKPPGMVVHPAPGNWNGTFVNALLFHCKTLPTGDSLRPGIVHRLDKETSGVLIAAKTSLAQQRLIALFSSRQVHKEYLAVCLGNPGEGKIQQPIGRHPVYRQKMCVKEGGREASTAFKAAAFDGALSLVEVLLETGRTHQIRVHMKHHGTPVLGDTLYGNLQANEKYHAKRQMLHAWKISFIHPITGKKLHIEAPIPEDIAHYSSRARRI